MAAGVVFGIREQGNKRIQRILCVFVEAAQMEFVMIASRTEFG
jgi:hypothetical protein